MKYLISIFIVVCCAVAVVSSIACADGCGMGKCSVMPAHGKMSRGMETDNIFFHKAHLILAKAAELGLSSDQTEKIKALKYSIEKSFIKEDADIKSLVLDIKEGLGKDEIDIDAVNKLIDQKYSLKAQKTKEAVGAYVNLEKILTQDQLKKLKEMCCRGMKGWHKGREERREPMAEGEESHKEGAE